MLNTGCQIGAALLGGAVGGLAGWKAGDVVDKGLGVNVSPKTFNSKNLFEKFIDITIDNPEITSALTGGLMNPTGMLESTSSNTVVDSKNTKIDKEIKSTVKGNLYVE